MLGHPTSTCSLDSHITISFFSTLPWIFTANSLSQAPNKSTWKPDFCLKEKEEKSSSKPRHITVLEIYWSMCKLSRIPILNFTIVSPKYVLQTWYIYINNLLKWFKFKLKITFQNWVVNMFFHSYYRYKFVISSAMSCLSGTLILKRKKKKIKKEERKKKKTSSLLNINSIFMSLSSATLNCPYLWN